jgi:hypothetical protein
MLILLGNSGPQASALLPATAAHPAHSPGGVRVGRDEPNLGCRPPCPAPPSYLLESDGLCGGGSHPGCLIRGLRMKGHGVHSRAGPAEQLPAEAEELTLL